MPSKQYWKIEGCEGLNTTFEKILPLSSLSEKAMVALLQRSDLQ